MGFAREGNRRAAQKGRELRLAEFFYKNGFIVEAQKPWESDDTVLQATPNDPLLDMYDDEHITPVEDPTSMNLRHFDYSVLRAEFESGAREFVWDDDGELT